MNKQFKKRILATIMLASFLISPSGNNFVVPSIKALSTYGMYNNKPINGLVHPVDVPQVKEIMETQLSRFVNLLMDKDKQYGTYYVSSNNFGEDDDDNWLHINYSNDYGSCSFDKELMIRSDTSNYDLKELNSNNFLQTTFENLRAWNNFVPQMPHRKIVFYEPNSGEGISNNDSTSNDFSSDNIIEKQFIPVLGLKTAAFAAYLHHLANSNPDLSPIQIFSDSRVKMQLKNWWGKILWVEKSGSEGVANGLGSVMKYVGLGDALENFIPNMNVKDPEEVALSVYYDSASWYQRVKYKLGCWGAFALKTTGVMVLPIGAWKFSGWAVKQFKNMALGASNMAKDQFLAERNKLLNDPIKLREAIKKMMQAGVVGLTDTIDKLTTLVTGNLALRKSKSLINRNRCQLISFVGPPGTGKSLLAQKYALALTGKEIPSWGYITSASIKPGVSPVDQFFDVNSNLIKNLKRCKGNTVIFIDEIDKFDSNDLLECLRDAVDRGTIVAMSKTSEQKKGIRGQSTSEVINTESIDVSGLIVIVGTNERPECWGLDPDPDEPAYNVGRTVVERSGSIVQRFQRFKFNPYTVDEYKQMYDNALKSIHDESQKMFGLQVEFDDDLSEDLALESECRLMGGRSVAIVLSEMAGAVTSFDIGAGEQSTTSRFGLNFFKKFSKSSPKKLKVSFDPSTHRFMIRQIDTSLPQ